MATEVASKSFDRVPSLLKVVSSFPSVLWREIKNSRLFTAVLVEPQMTILPSFCKAKFVYVEFDAAVTIPFRPNEGSSVPGGATKT